MNMQQIMQQAQRMQKDILAKKEEIDKSDFVGNSAWVEIKFKGSKEVTSVKITDESVLNLENKDILEDMIMLAIKDGIEKINSETEKKLGAYSQFGGIF